MGAGRSEQNGGEFLVEARRSLADVVLADSLTSYLEINSDCLDDFPGLKDLQARMIAEPGIAAYLSSPNQWRRPDDQYVIDIAAVLERALPAHMPDPHGRLLLADRVVCKSPISLAVGPSLVQTVCC